MLKLGRWEDGRKNILWQDNSGFVLFPTDQLTIRLDRLTGRSYSVSSSMFYPQVKHQTIESCKECEYGASIYFLIVVFITSVWMLYWTLYMKEVYLYRWRADSRLIGPCYSTVKSYLCVVKPDYSLTDIRILTGRSASYRYVYRYTTYY